MLATVAVGFWGDRYYDWLGRRLAFPLRILTIGARFVEVALVVVLGAASFASLAAGFLALLRQAKVWLKTGYWVEMDLLWAFSDKNCLAKVGRDLWSEARDGCRPDSIPVSDWIGLNRAVDWFLEMHIAVPSVFLCIGLYALALELSDR